MVNQNFWDVNEFMNLEVRYGEKSIEKMAFTLKDTDIHVLKYHSSRDASHHYSYKYFIKKIPDMRLAGPPWLKWQTELSF